MKAKDVSAVIVTRGDVDLAPILKTLPYGEKLIWDNSKQPHDLKCFGRYIAADTAKHDVIFFQDDDIIFSQHDALLAAWEPDKLIVNMPSPWYEQCMYDQNRQALVGGGSLCPKGLWMQPFERYLAQYPRDDLFLDYCDFVFGIQAPHTRYDFGFQVLPHADAPGRIYNSPGALGKKRLAMGRASHLPDVPTMFDASWYDRWMVDTDSPAVLPVEDSPWLPTYMEVAKLIDPWEPVIDLGCGTGRFLSLLVKQGHYGPKIGVDWSNESLKEARRYVGDEIEWQWTDLDAWIPEPTERSTVFTCTEVLEHLPRDRDLVAKIPRGNRFLFTVPNFYSVSHERVYADFREVVERYGDLLEFRRWVAVGSMVQGIHICETRRR